MADLKAVLGWATVDPTSGNGNKSITVTTAAPYTGRTSRKQTIQVVGSGLSAKSVIVNQKAKAEFVDLQASATVAKTGGTLTVTGTSNSSKLTFSVAAGAKPLTLTLPANYSVAGTNTANGAVIAGDPGASAEYNFSVVFTNIPVNATISELTSTLTVTAAGGMTDTCPITQAAGDPTLTVSATEITLEASGAAKTFSITSNTSWTIKI